MLVAPVVLAGLSSHHMGFPGRCQEALCVAVAACARLHVESRAVNPAHTCLRIRVCAYVSGRILLFLSEAQGYNRPIIPPDYRSCRLSVPCA